MYRFSLLIWLIVALQSQAGLEWQSMELKFDLPFGQSQATGEYRFTNTGETPVVITQIKTNCGCTTTALEKRTYAPGESGVLQATLVLQEGETQRRRMVFVHTEAKPDDPIVLTIAATKPTILTLTPRLLIWNPNEALTAKTVTVKVEIAEAVHIVEASANSNRYVVNIETVKKGKHYLIHITPTTTEVMSTARISVVSDFPKGNPVTYSCYARVLQPLEPTP